MNLKGMTMKTISFKTYKRRDGNVMVYINRSNGVSVGISHDQSSSAYSKGMTDGKRNAMKAAFEVFRANAVPFTGDLKNHTEMQPIKMQFPEFILVWTDECNIGGMQVSSDGPYLIYDGLILRCGEYEEGV